MTEEEYLEFEGKSEERHEYNNGVLRLMDDVTFDHNDIVLNFVVKLLPVARAKKYRLRNGRALLKVSLENKTVYYYPDLALLGTPQSENKYLIENPCFVIEVLSESTEHIDKGEKLETYQRIASLKQYVLVDQTRRKIEVYTRDESDWRYKMLETGEFNVACLDIMMTLDEVYAGLEFSAEQPSQ